MFIFAGDCADSHEMVNIHEIMYVMIIDPYSLFICGCGTLAGKHGQVSRCG